MTYFQIRRIESFMTSTARTGAQSKQVRARHRRDGKGRNDRGEEQDHALQESILAILTSATSVPAVVSLTSSKRCLAGRPEEAEADEVVAEPISKLSSSYHWKKRIEGYGARCRWRWLRPARLVVEQG